MYALTLTLAAGLALADDVAQETERVQARFEALDRNSDRLISKEEAKASRDLAQRFAAVDANSDGYVSAEEYLARPSGEHFE
jgi:Ca2+-binding EF-hand superfamily protein